MGFYTFVLIVKVSEAYHRVEVLVLDLIKNIYWMFHFHNP